MSKELRIKDETLLNEAVIAYREQFLLTPNKGYRRDICVTVKTYDDLCLWQDLLAHWGYNDRKTGKWKARNPLDIKGLLTCFEFKQREAQRKKDELREKAVSARSGSSIPTRPLGRMSDAIVPLLPKGSHGFRG